MDTPRGNPAWTKGKSGNPSGRPKVAWQVKQCARENSEAAMRKIVALMNNDDPRVALAAAIHVLDRAYGKPEQKADIEMVHRFAQVPAVMSKADWLATRGDPKLLELSSEPRPRDGSDADGSRYTANSTEAEKPKDPNSKLN